jgi:hypothetical protein
MTRTASDDFDHPLVPAGHRLTRHVLYRLSEEAWLRTRRLPLQLAKARLGRQRQNAARTGHSRPPASSRRRPSMTIEADLNIAEILYESGAIKFRYARVMAPDKTRWIRHGLFAAYHEHGTWPQKGSTSTARRMGFGATSIQRASLQPRAGIAGARRSEFGDSGSPTEPKSRARTTMTDGQNQPLGGEIRVKGRRSRRRR